MEEFFNLNDFEKDPFALRYQGKVLLDERTVRIDVEGGEGETEETLQARVYEQMGWLTNNFSAVSIYITEELLEIKNESWLQEGEAPMNGMQLRSGLRLTHVRLAADKSMELAYTAGPIFWGHWVVVGINPDYTFFYATLEG